MEKVYHLIGESCAVLWTTKFKISGRKPQYSLHLQCIYPTLSSSTNCTGDNIPEKIVAACNGETMEMKSNDHLDTWGMAINPHENLIFFKLMNQCFGFSYSNSNPDVSSCQHQPEVIVMCIIDFPSNDKERVVVYEPNIHFTVNGVRIDAHKNIVASVSPVMGAMFKTNNFKEGRNNTVEIDDIDSEVFQQLLLYIYTGTAPLLEEKSMARHLLIAADKYLVEGLKQVCINRLIFELTVDSVLHTLVIAHTHSAPNLLEGSLQFIAKYGREVRSLPEWKELLEDHQELFFMTSERIISGKSGSRRHQEVTVNRHSEGPPQIFFPWYF